MSEADARYAATNLGPQLLEEETLLQKQKDEGLLEAEEARRLHLATEIHLNEARFQPLSTSVRLLLKKEDGTVLFASGGESALLEGEKAGMTASFSYEVRHPLTKEKVTLVVDAFVIDPLLNGDPYAKDAALLKGIYEHRTLIFISGILAAVLLVLSSVYLGFSAGKRKIDGKEELVQGGLHLIPLDLLALGVGVLVVALFFRARNLEQTVIAFHQNSSAAMGLLYYIAMTGILCCCIWGLLQFILMSLIIRVRLRSLTDRSFLVHFAQGAAEQLAELYLNRSLLGRNILWIIVLALVTALLGMWIVRPVYWWILILYVLIIVTAAIILINVYQRHQKKMRATIHRMAEGDLGRHINTEGMTGAVLLEAEELNRINDAVQEAVDERMRSERMKTELLTNVTHDIKTPLTNIINYVDLLKRSDEKEGAELSKEQRAYLEVLEAQSTRLKKLIEDLIEASKASTGNIKINRTVLDLREMLEQAAGEYQDRFAKKELTLVKDFPDEEILTVADGEQLWRVFDNVLNNAEKYALSGSQVQMTVKTIEDDTIVDHFIGSGEPYSSDAVEISIKNISRLPLNKTGQELTERFVRGDASRHSEGSGLGLAIAKSLTELMGGKFSIETEGDIFTVVITLLRT